tara:strand:- start:389 stop:1261 length:873 start_codon:yes stop_codon:yes gene_type:complete
MRQTLVVVLVVVLVAIGVVISAEYISHYYIFVPKCGLNRHIIKTRVQNVPHNAIWLAQLTDKHKVKGIVMDLHIANLDVPKTFAYARACGEIPWEHLPENFVLKPTHSSGVFHVCMKCSDAKQKCATYVSKTLKRSYNPRWKRLLHKLGVPLVEHHYDLIEPGIIVEELLADNRDWKFHVYNGRVHFVIVCYDRVSHTRHRRAAVTRSFEPLAWNRYVQKLAPTPPPRPEAWNRMVEIAEELATRLVANEYVRVDLYYDKGRILLGELTFISEGGRGRFDPVDVDEHFSP